MMCASSTEFALVQGRDMPTYNITKSYEWNYEHGPDFHSGVFQRHLTPQVRLLDFKLSSRFGIPAGLLLNSRWVKRYAELGFDLLTYKTVRTSKRESLPFPNCLPVYTDGQLTPDRFSEPLIGTLQYSPDDPSKFSITNSLGVPSTDPREWQKDVEACKQYLGQGQILIVSVVGTYEDGQTQESFVRDFTRCAMLAGEAGADVVELNLSCPNSPAEEGALYTEPDLAGEIARSVKREIKDTPLFLKVGYFEDRSLLEQMVERTAGSIEGIVAINTIKMTVVDREGRQALPGANRARAGICGAGIKALGLQTCRWLVDLREKGQYDFVIIGVGGAMTPHDIDDYVETGADGVQSCTAAMWNPYLAIEYYLSHFSRELWRKGRSPEIVDYSQTGAPERIDPDVLRRQSLGEIMILLPIWGDVRTCPACGARLKDVSHQFRSYRFCPLCRDSVPVG